MGMDTALEGLTRELNALERAIRMRGFVLTAPVADEGQEPSDSRIVDTRVSYFGIWE